MTNISDYDQIIKYYTGENITLHGKNLSTIHNYRRGSYDRSDDARAYLGIRFGESAAPYKFSQLNVFYDANAPMPEQGYHKFKGVIPEGYSQLASKYPEVSEKFLFRDLPRINYSKDVMVKGGGSKKRQKSKKFMYNNRLTRKFKKTKKN